MSQEKISECKSCGAEIVWMKTQNDKNICVDLPIPEDPHREDILAATLFDRSWMKTHFETCPYADQHRKPRGAGQAPATVEDSQGALSKKLNIAVAVLADILNSPADGMRSQTLARVALSQIRGIR